MANYLLVHGAWGGAWYWRPVQHALIRAGHHAHAVTLTGLGERAHLLSPAITLETHIADVRAALAAEELADCILVAHSYADRKSTRLNSSHHSISYAVFCFKNKRCRPWSDARFACATLGRRVTRRRPQC